MCTLAGEDGGEADAVAVSNPEGQSTQYSRTLAPKATKGMALQILGTWTLWAGLQTARLFRACSWGFQDPQEGIPLEVLLGCRALWVAVPREPVGLKPKATKPPRPKSKAILGRFTVDASGAEDDSIRTPQCQNKPGKELDCKA